MFEVQVSAVSSESIFPFSVACFWTVQSAMSFSLVQVVGVVIIVCVCYA